MEEFKKSRFNRISKTSLIPKTRLGLKAYKVGFKGIGNLVGIFSKQ